jgi:opacity protein-like surface antigen
MVSYPGHHNFYEGARQVRKLLIMVGLITTFAICGFAQDVPKAEIFGGYSYFSADIRETVPFQTNPTDRISLNGWNASLTGYMSRFFGVTADFGGHYGSPEVSGSTLDTKIHTFMFGPQIAVRSERASVFGHALFGGARIKADNPIIGNAVQDTGFAWGVGGGIDLGLSHNFAIRPAQFDYIWTKAKPTGLPDPDQAQNNFRYSAGIVLRF